MTNFTVVNLGCKVNRVESDDYEALLLNAGLKESPLEDSDLVIINSCAVTGEAEKKTRKAVRHALAHAADAEVLVTGCAAALDPQSYEALDGRVKTVPKGEMESYLDRRFSSSCHDESDLASSLTSALSFSRLRRGVKIQDGCDHACSYCVVSIARGPAVSFESDQVIKRVKALRSQGVREIVLTGINLGSYNASGLTLAGLLRLLLNECADKNPEEFWRLRLSSIEPMDVDDELIELMASSEGRICRHLHLPLQSGSSRVLKEMYRPYRAEDFEKLVGRLRKAMPDVALTTDIIAGFPGETEEDFEETLALARESAFSRIHGFPYSLREGTPAAKRPDQIPPEIKRERAQRLRELSESLERKDKLRRQGSKEWVFMESAQSGRSESYHLVYLTEAQSPGSLLSLTLEKDMLGL